MNWRDSRGFGLLETLVGLTILTLTLGGLATMLIEHSRMNKTEQLQSKTQADARNCLLVVLQQLRSAGWDPTELSFDAVTGDTDLTDGISWIEVRADLNGDGDLDEDFEQLVIRHMGSRVEWRTSPDADFVVVAEDISNDADGDGVVEPMFQVHGTPPDSVEVTVTAQSQGLHPRTNEPLRYTVASEIDLRPRLLPLR